MLHLPLALVLLSAAPAESGKLKILAKEIEAGMGVDPQVAHLLSTTVTSELRRSPHLAVVGQDDIRELLGFEKQKQLLGCTDATCLAEIGGALGVDQLLVGSLAQLGQTYVFVLRRVDVRTSKVVGDVKRELKLKEQDALLDAIPPMLQALFPGEVAPPSAPAAAVSAPAPSRAKPGPAPWIVAGAGGVVAAVGLALLLDAVLGGSTKNGVTSYTYAEAQSANALGYAGQGCLYGGAAIAAAGIAWGLLRPTGEAP